MHELTLNKNPIGSECCSKLLGSLCYFEDEHKPTISALNLAECGIAYINIARAADFAQRRITLRIVLSITQHTSLERLDLRRNRLEESNAYNER